LRENWSRSPVKKGNLQERLKYLGWMNARQSWGNNSEKVITLWEKKPGLVVETAASPRKDMKNTRFEWEPLIAAKTLAVAIIPFPHRKTNVLKVDSRLQAVAEGNPGSRIVFVMKLGTKCGALLLPEAAQ
jgi:hypothetical protein